MDAFLEAVMQIQKCVFLSMYRSEKGLKKWAHKGCSLITVILHWEVIYFTYTTSIRWMEVKIKKGFSLMWIVSGFSPISTSEIGAVLRKGLNRTKSMIIHWSVIRRSDLSQCTRKKKKKDMSGLFFQTPGVFHLLKQLIFFFLLRLALHLMEH